MLKFIKGLLAILKPQYMVIEEDDYPEECSYRFYNTKREADEAFDKLRDAKLGSESRLYIHALKVYHRRMYEFQD